MACLAGPYSDWYPEGRKIVPADLETLTPLSLAVWFCDDGNMRPSSSKGSRPGIMVSKFATLGFPDEGVRRLALILREVTDQSWTTAKDKGGLNIYGADAASRALAEIIDPVLPGGMERKAFWRTPASVVTAPLRTGWKAGNIHCSAGHPWDEANTRAGFSGRECRVCGREWQRALREQEGMAIREWAVA